MQKEKKVFNHDQRWRAAVRHLRALDTGHEIGKKEQKTLLFLIPGYPNIHRDVFLRARQSNWRTVRVPDAPRIVPKPRNMQGGALSGWKRAKAPASSTGRS